MMKSKRILYIAIGVVAAIFVIFVLILGIQSKDKTATLDIQSAVPDDITVTVDGAKVSSNEKVGVKPGSHKVVAERKGFESKTQTVEVKAFETKVVRLLLKPNGPEGSEWARAHPDAFLEYEALAGKQYEQKVQEMNKAFPIVTILPEVRSTWRIDYGVSQKNPKDPNAIAVYVTYGSEDAKQLAIEWVKEQGYNLDDYEVIFKTPEPQPGG